MSMCYNKAMKKIIIGMGLAAFLLPAISFAAYFNANKMVVINPDQAINENAYIAGGNVMASGAVNGDLLAAGGTVSISGKVTQDIMAAGGTILMTGISAQDVRVAGGNLMIGGILSGELAAAGGQVTVTPDSRIAKDSYLRGGTVTFSGDEAGSLDVGGGTVYIYGTIEKDLKVQSTQKLVIGSGAIVKGNLEYSAPTEATIEAGAQVLGETTFHKIEPAKQSGNRWGPLAGFLSFWWLAKFFMILAVTYVLWYVWRKDMIDVITESTSHFWREMLRGFVFLVAVFAAIIVAFISMIGAMVGVVAALFYISLIIISCAVTIIVVSSLIMRRRTDLRWYHILLGAAVAQIVMIIPVVGWFAYFIVYLASFGALLGVLRHRFAR